jgi:hypothetical protein
MLSVSMDLMGALVRRSWVRWAVQHWKIPLYVWGALSLLVLAFFIFLAFDSAPAPQYRGYPSAYSAAYGGQSGGIFSLMFSGIRWEGGFLGFFFSLAGLGVVSVVAPLLVVIVPAFVVSLPFVVFAGAVWLLVFVLGGLGLISASPFLLATGGRALFIHMAARWLASSDQRERTETAVMSALGLGGASLRSIDGKARIMDGEELARLQGQTSAGREIRLGKVGGEWFDHATEKHVLVCASTRGGKGVNLIIPNLLRYRGSVFVLDPKGENAKITHEERREFGKVQVLDPFGVSGLPSCPLQPAGAVGGRYGRY